MEIQGTQNTENNFEKDSQFQNILENYSNQDLMVLV